MGTTADLYVSSADQVLEERVSGTATAQYVWSPVYVDALVLRDRDTDANGSLDERRWVQQDANWNVTALLDNSGAVVERYAYDPYGNFMIYDASWTSRSSSSYAWMYQHQGLRYDGGAGLYHARARDLSPSLGRWLQNDPAGFGAGDVDLYRAYGNGPTGAVDPGGMEGLISAGQRLRNGFLTGLDILADSSAGRMADSFYGTIKKEIVPAALEFNRNFWAGVEMQIDDPIGSAVKMKGYAAESLDKLAKNYDAFGERLADAIVKIIDDPGRAWNNSDLRKGLCEYAKDPPKYTGKFLAYLGMAILAQGLSDAFFSAFGPLLEAGPAGEAATDLSAGSIRNVNPGYPNAPGRSQNCVNCSIATDATLNGRASSALPSGPKPITTLEAEFGARFRPIPSIADAEAELLQAGHGSRAIIFGSRGPGQVGHVFNGVNQNGVVRFLDGQTGTQATTSGFQGLMILRTK